MPLFKLFRSKPQAPAAPPAEPRRPARPKASAASSSSAPPPPPVPQAPQAPQVTAETVQQRVRQVRDNLIQPIQEVLAPAYSEDMEPILDMLMTEAGQGVEQLQQQAEVCMAEERFDILEEISTLSSDYQELQAAAERWRQGGASGVSLSQMSARQQEEAQEAWLRQEEERMREDEARYREQEEVQQRWLEEQQVARREEAARQEEQQRRAEEEAEREARRAAEEQERLAREEAERQMREEEEARIEELEMIRQEAREADRRGEEAKEDFDLQLEDFDEEVPARTLGPTEAQQRSEADRREEQQLAMEREQRQAEEQERLAREAAEREQRRIAEEKERLAREEAEREQKRIAEENARLAREEAERERRRAAEEQERRAREEAEQEQRRIAEENERRAREEAEQRRIAEEKLREEAEQEQRRIAEEAERRRLLEERLAQEVVEEPELVDTELELEECSNEEPQALPERPRTGPTVEVRRAESASSTSESEQSKSAQIAMGRPSAGPAGACEERAEEADGEAEPSLKSRPNSKQSVREEPFRLENESKRVVDEAPDLHTWAADLHRWAQEEEMVPEEDVARRSVFMKDALEQSWRSESRVQEEASSSAHEDASRHQAATCFVQAFKEAEKGQGSFRTHQRPVARPRSEEDRLALERSTRKALEDAEFWDLPLEEALRSLKTRPLRSKEHTRRISEAFQARKSKSKSKSCDVWAGGAPVVEQRLPVQLPVGQLSAPRVSAQLRVASAPTDAAFGERFLRAVAEAAQVDPKRIRIKAVRPVPSSGPTTRPGV